MIVNRSDKRFSLSLEVFFLNIITETVDLSLGGMQIITNGDIPNNNISIGMQLSDQVFIQMFGEAVWSRNISDAKQVYGIKFINLSNNVKHVLEDYLSI